MVKDLPYQTLFDAIAAATKVEGGAVSISVEAFRSALTVEKETGKEEPFVSGYDDGLRQGMADVAATTRQAIIKALAVLKIYQAGSMASRDEIEGAIRAIELNDLASPSPSVSEMEALRRENERLRAISLDFQQQHIKQNEALQKISDITARCEHDGGFDREIGPIGCDLGDKCVCIGIHPVARTVLQDASPSTSSLRSGNDPLFWMRLGARAMRLSARAACGNHWESSQEDAMTSAGLSKLDKEKLYAEANASEEISKVISEKCEDSALGYAIYMGDEADKKLLAALGVTSDWLYRHHTGEPSRKELAASTALSQKGDGK